MALASSCSAVLNPWRHCLALSWNYYLPPSHHHCQLNSPSPHSSQVNARCPKCFQVHHSHDFWQDHGQSLWFCGHSILECVLQRGPLQTKLVTQVIFPTIQTQPLHHVASLIRTCWHSLQYVKYIRRCSSACIQCKIPSVQHISSGCPFTLPKTCGLWLFCAMYFSLRLSSLPSHY